MRTTKDDVMRDGVGDRVAGLERELERYKEAVQKAVDALNLIRMGGGRLNNPIADRALSEINSILNP